MHVPVGRCASTPTRRSTPSRPASAAAAASSSPTWAISATSAPGAGEPGRGVRARAAGAQRDPRGRVARDRQRRVVEGHDVEHHLADDDDHAAAISAASAALRSTRRTLARSDSPSLRRWKRSSRNGVTSRPLTPCSAAACEAFAQQPVVQLGVHRLVERVGHHDRAGRADRLALAQHRRDLLRRLHAPRERQPGRRQVEGGERVGAVAEHGHVERLEPLERRGDVEDRLHARADHADPDPRERAQVRGLVEGVARAAVHAAEPAGGEHADAGQRRQVRGRGDGRRAVLAARQHRREVADAALGHLARRGQRLELVVARARSAPRRRGSRSSPAPPRARAPRPRSPAPRAGCPAAAARGR